jgi:thymidylate synthase
MNISRVLTKKRQLKMIEKEVKSEMNDEEFILDDLSDLIEELNAHKKSRRQLMKLKNKSS